MSDSNLKDGVTVASTKDIGSVIRQARKEAEFTQLEVAGIFGSGNRFIVDAENGKETIQAQKLIDLLNILGLEVVVRKK